jgi:hypothetical protein
VTVYDKGIELKMQRLFQMLSEKDRRRYAGIEAAKLGHGGIEYVSGLFGMDPKTVRRGLVELEVNEDPAPTRIRKKRCGT